MSIPGQLIPMVLFGCVTVAVIGVPIARAYARKLDRGDTPQPLTSSDVTARLERMEQAIDSIAIEVERISEGQRFTTKLLAERNNEGSPNVPTRQP
jgi:hypothetical protein